MRTLLVGLGMLGFLAALFAGTLATIWGIGAGSSATNTPNPSIQGRKIIPPAQARLSLAVKPSKFVSVGQKTTAGALSWTVTDVRRVKELHTYTSPPGTENGDFLVVTFTVKNVSKIPVTLTDNSLVLIYRNARTKRLPAAVNNTQYIPPAKDLLFTKESLLNPGETKKGRVNFDLTPFGSRPPDNLSGLALRLGDAAPTAHDEKYVKLKPGSAS